MLKCIRRSEEMYWTYHHMQYNSLYDQYQQLIRKTRQCLFRYCWLKRCGLLSTSSKCWLSKIEIRACSPTSITRRLFSLCSPQDSESPVSTAFLTCSEWLWQHQRRAGSRSCNGVVMPGPTLTCGTSHWPLPALVATVLVPARPCSLHSLVPRPVVS